MKKAFAPKNLKALFTRNFFRSTPLILLLMVFFVGAYVPGSLAAPDSDLYFNPASNSVAVDADFTLDVMVDPGANLVNGIEINITFDHTKLRLDDIALSGSFPLPIGENINNTTGTANIGGATNWGTTVTTTSAVATFSFHALAEVTDSPILITSSSLVTADNENDSVLVNRTGATVTVGSPAPVSKEITALKTGDTITVDGNLNEYVWSQANSVTFTNPGHSDNTAKVSTLWDDNNLYFAYEVIDGSLEATDAELWNDDGAEIQIDTTNDKTTSPNAGDYQFFANIHDLISLYDLGNNSNPVNGASAKKGTKTGGYTLEVAIPWSAISTTPLADKVIGILIANNDRDNGQGSQFDWNGLIDVAPGSFARPNLWGELTLSGQVVEKTYTLADFTILKDHWLEPVDDGENGDISFNGMVDSQDLGIMMSNWATP